MRIHRLLYLASVLLAAPLAAQDSRPSAAKIDITGNWAFSVISPAGQGTPTVVFKQKGDSISGTYKSNALGTKEFIGTLKEGKIAFEFPAESGGQQFMMSFSGTVDDKDNMKGSIDFSGMATGSFTGKRSAAP
jgi:hypothetical protein